MQPPIVTGFTKDAPARIDLSNGYTKNPPVKLTAPKPQTNNVKKTKNEKKNPAVAPDCAGA